MSEGEPTDDERAAAMMADDIAEDERARTARELGLELDYTTTTED